MPEVLINARGSASRGDRRLASPAPVELRSRNMTDFARPRYAPYPDRVPSLRVAQPPLRIAMFVNEFPALSETFVLNQITGLLDLGHIVTIFANGPRADTAVHSDVRHYRLRERVRYRSMPKNRGARLLGAPGVAGRLGARHLRPLLAALNVLDYGREAISLNLLHWADCLVDEDEFDIIHCQFGTIGRMVAILREIGAIKGRLVTTFHGVDMSACLAGKPDLYRHLFRSGDLFLPISDHWRQRLIELGCDPARIEIHGMGVDPSRFAAWRERPAATHPLRVITVGRMVEKKGIEYGLRAVAKLAAGSVPVRYTIVGGGPLTEPLKLLARDLGIAHSVEFCGWRTQREIVELLRDNDVLLAPSVTDGTGDQEGIPVTLMEAMASSLPVVSTRHSGIPELVEDGVSGFLFSERDADGPADALDRLWRDPALRDRIGMAARARVAATHDIDALNAELVRHYRSLL